MSHLFCFGLGYSACVLARRLREKGWRVSGTVREAGAAAALRADGFEVFPFDGVDADPAISAALRPATHLLVSAPPSAEGDPVLRRFAADIAARAGLGWIGYLSTVGVYGDHGGAWIDETAPCRPVNARSRWRLEAESAWRTLAGNGGIPLAIFRLAGIYGPGRNQLASLKAGTARRVVKPGQVFNRIHVDDVARVLEASIARPPERTRIYNVCDDEPAPPQEVVAFAAALMGIDPPPEIPFAGAGLSDMARSFYADNKRCRNERIRRELGVALAWPTYREGLRALFEAGAY